MYLRTSKFMEILLTIITFLYASTGIIGAIGYIPTIRDLINGIASANINSYIIWTLSTGIGFLYAFFVISDLLLEIVMGLNFAFCTTILILDYRLKYKKK
jgi:hypothetical protein